MLDRLTYCSSFKCFNSKLSLCSVVGAVLLCGVCIYSMMGVDCFIYDYCYDWYDLPFTTTTPDWATFAGVAVPLLGLAAAGLRLDVQPVRQWHCNRRRHRRRHVRGPRIALIVTCTYEKEFSSLPSCANDGLKMVEMLQRRGFQVTWLRDDLSNIDEQHELYPTKENVELWMDALTKNARANDSLFFYYSGHGTDASAEDSSSEDRDQYICTHGGDIMDNSVREYLVHGVPLSSKNVTLFAVFDSCHSQSIMDLPYEYYPRPDSIKVRKEDFEYQREPPQGTAPGLAVYCLSGCDDDSESSAYSISPFFKNIFGCGNSSLTEALCSNINGRNMDEVFRNTRRSCWEQTPHLQTLTDDPKLMTKSFNEAIRAR